MALRPRGYWLLASLADWGFGGDQGERNAAHHTRHRRATAAALAMLRRHYRKPSRKSPQSRGMVPAVGANGARAVPSGDSRVFVIRDANSLPAASGSPVPLAETARSVAAMLWRESENRNDPGI